MLKPEDLTEEELALLYASYRADAAMAMYLEVEKELGREVRAKVVAKGLAVDAGIMCQLTNKGLGIIKMYLSKE